MAVNPQMPKLTNQFWLSFSKNISALAIFSQFINVAIIAYLAIAAGLFAIDSVLLWLILVGIFIINCFLSLFIISLATYPTKSLLGALMQVSGQKTTITPPNPNSRRNEKTGLKDALQTIYSLSSSNNLTQIDQKSVKQEIISDSLNITNCGIVTLDSHGKIIFSNRAAPVRIDSNGVSSIELLFNGNDTIDSWLESCNNNAVHAEKTWTRIANRLPNQEDRRFFDVIASYQKGKSAETVIMFIDKTSLYNIDEENLDFISFAAHELRGPITVIRGYLDVLNDELDGVFEGDQKELFHRLIVSSNRLSNYIDNILNTSKYDRRHLKLHLVEDSLSNIYDIISDDMNLRAGAQNRLLSVNIPKDLPTVAADRASISEVLGNLIDNAIKYSNEGGSIIVTARVNGDFVETSIEDHGIGMPSGVVNNLFQKFYRSHRSRETVSGTGIGLYISKAVVESHGGTIGVRSEDGRGSIFTVQIPIYSTVADKLQSSHNINEGLISEGNGWIKNHSMYRS